MVTTSASAGVFGPSKGKINAIKNRAEEAGAACQKLQQELIDAKHKEEARTVEILARLDALEKRDATIVKEVELNVRGLGDQVNYLASLLEGFAHKLEALAQFTSKLGQLNEIVDRLVGAEKELDAAL